MDASRSVVDTPSRRITMHGGQPCCNRLPAVQSVQTVARAAGPARPYHGPVAEPGDEAIDRRVLDRLADALNDRAAVRAALDGWLAELPRRLDDIRHAAQRGTDLRLPAQRLQSPSATLGLVAVADACRALAHPDRQAATGELLRELDDALLATWTALGPWS
jgi:hypothetical protein